MSYVRTTRFKRGFTLVELSIVIVIIGLIVSGVTAGSSLVKSAKLNRVVADLKKYDTAFSAFKLQYGYLPGDLPNAESYWGTYNSSTNPTGVQNGNGDRNICCSDAPQQESMQSWTMLSKAKLVQGSFLGQTTMVNSFPSAVIGVTNPVSSYSSLASFWPRMSMACNSTNGCSAAQAAKLPQGNTLEFTGVTWWGWIDYQIDVKDAANLDAKIDDGTPDRGHFSCFNYTNFSGVTPLACGTYGVSYNINNDTKCTCEFLLSTPH